MANTAFTTMFRRETIAGFEQKQSLLRQSVTTEAMMEGRTATFLVADSGGATAVTRGVNGLIPGRSNNLTQTSITLNEWHDVPEITGFNIFASQGDQVALLQSTARGVISRKIDDEIITVLNTGTVNTGTAQTANLALALRAKTILGNSDVPFDGNIWALITPAFEAYLLQNTEFSSADYTTRKPLDSGATAWKDMPGFYNWMGVKWIVHPNLPGKGTSAEKCFMYHTSAVGHAANTNDMKVVPGYEERHDYSYCRVSIFMGSAKLQNAGIVVMNHDGSALAAA